MDGNFFGGRLHRSDVASRYRGVSTMMLRLGFSFLLMLVLQSAAIAEKRVALVIGNSTYARAGKLPNPLHDARAIEVMLRCCA
jgi:hypothetical protein